MNNVYPSGLDLTTNSVPVTPPPPVLLIMTSDWGEYLVQTFPTARASRSVEPPAAYGIIRVICLDGNFSWANAAPGTIRAATNTIMKLLTTIFFIPFLLSVKWIYKFA